MDLSVFAREYETAPPAAPVQRALRDFFFPPREDW